MELPLYILTGGRSSRFGSDKAHALVDGVPLATRVAHSLRPAVSDVVLVSRSLDAHADLGFRCIADDMPDRGPLAGLAAALDDRLAARGPGWLLLAACDLIDPRPEWVQRLADHTTEDAQAICFAGEQLEPLFALYHTAAMPEVRQQIDRGIFAVHRLVRSLPHRCLPLPPAGLRQANHPSDLDS